MSDNDFKTWLSQNGDQQFWRSPIPSERLDGIITNKHIQKSIAHSRKNQLLYSFIENKIVADYAWLIDFKLREAFNKLELSEFIDPKGFECEEKSSIHQYNYFKLRNQLEFFLKHDIQQHHGLPDAQTNAFRRWVEISDLLLKKHCYEGFLLVFINLQLIATPHLINGLPQGIQKNYHELCDLSSPDKNHLALRYFINKNKNEYDFSPLIFNYHAIAVLNASIVQIREREFLLQDRKKVVIKEIHRLKKEYDPSVFDKISLLIKEHRDIPQDLQEKNLYLIDLLRERKCIPGELKKNKQILEEQFVQRSNLLNQIEKEKNSKVSPIPDYLQERYQKICSRFDKQKMKQLMSKSLELSIPHEGKSSRLYTHRLVPSFWQRKGKSVEKHWNSLFTPSCLHSK